METLTYLRQEAVDEIDKQHKVLDKGYVKLIDFMGGDSSVVRAARQSTTGDLKSYEEDVKLLSYLYRNQHMTPFEMVEIVFELKVPMVIGEQILRHRTFSYNKFSGRYSQMPDEYYRVEKKVNWNSEKVDLPYFLPAQNKKNNQSSDGMVEVPMDVVHNWLDEADSAFDSYSELIDSGVSKEVARLNLPLSTYTKMWMKGNLRNFMHFLELRMDSHAQWETQQYANKMHEIISKIASIS